MENRLSPTSLQQPSIPFERLPCLLLLLLLAEQTQFIWSCLTNCVFKSLHHFFCFSVNRKWSMSLFKYPKLHSGITLAKVLLRLSRTGDWSVSYLAWLYFSGFFFSFCHQHDIFNYGIAHDHFCRTATESIAFALVVTSSWIKSIIPLEDHDMIFQTISLICWDRARIQPCLLKYLKFLVACVLCTFIILVQFCLRKTISSIMPKHLIWNDSCLTNVPHIQSQNVSFLPRYLSSLKALGSTIVACAKDKGEPHTSLGDVDAPSPTTTTEFHWNIPRVGTYSSLKILNKKNVV